VFSYVLKTLKAAASVIWTTVSVVTTLCISLAVLPQWTSCTTRLRSSCRAAPPSSSIIAASDLRSPSQALSPLRHRHWRRGAQRLLATMRRQNAGENAVQLVLQKIQYICATVNSCHYNSVYQGLL
jgi:hypothetical protein